MKSGTADVKANKNSKKSDGFILQYFAEILSKFEIHCKKGMYFSFDFG